MNTTVLDREIIYPDSDGKPMADNTKQFQWIVTIEGGLEALFADRADVFVAGDLLWYPVEGDNKTRAAPDAMVVFGRPKGHRGSYKQWCEQDIAPQVVFEVLSPGNTSREMDAKRLFYERYGVEEYYLYDPDRGLLQGWLRSRGRLRAIEKMQGWVSPRLGVRFDLDGLDLCLYGPDGERFVTYLESRQKTARERQERFDAIPRLRQLGLTAQQIAQALNLPEQIVRGDNEH
ncbi:MAG: Uma2 family endonuclease [Candidatus Competibacteraceae bacterium]